MQTCERIGIFGAGTMGHSIALSAAWAGHTVNVWGSDELDIARRTASPSASTPFGKVQRRLQKSSYLSKETCPSSSTR